MVFKPWTDQRALRHLLEDNEEDFSTPLHLPNVSMESSEGLKSFTGTLLVIPESLKFITETLNKLYPETSTLAELVIKKKFTRRIDSEDFIEDEQLYAATEADKVHEEIVSSTISITKYTELLAICCVKNYENIDKINYTLVSTSLLNSSTNATIVTLTPGTLPFDQLIATLGGKWSTEQYVQLVPPFVVTGIAGSLISQAQILGKEVHALVLQSEGVPGFEKVNEYAVEEIANLLKDRFKLGDEFTKTLNVVLHSGKSVNNLGLYL
ncbi:Proteasome chaperone 1 [Cyberlindnera fabianii]|uniref:Proteasome chaperone 1 n=1 Tax=Cyberlindnera fabianii TaxID=36022 RepID=A0A1V2KZX8_CYBFA|nr:Proteasome chaperone 1 [Cyberlindnera fabianii]